MCPAFQLTSHLLKDFNGLSVALRHRVHKVISRNFRYGSKFENDTNLEISEKFLLKSYFPSNFVKTGKRVFCNKEVSQIPRLERMKILSSCIRKLNLKVLSFVKLVLF